MIMPSSEELREMHREYLLSMGWLDDIFALRDEFGPDAEFIAEWLGLDTQVVRRVLQAGALGACLREPNRARGG
jgi:hypothetical protein